VNVEKIEQGYGAVLQINQIFPNDEMAKEFRDDLLKIIQTVSE